MPTHQIYRASFFRSILVICDGMGSSFPAIPDPLPQRRAAQAPGYGASAGMVFVNYIISLGLGFAGMVAGEVNNGGDTYENKEKGCFDALYFELRLSGLGLMLSLLFLARKHFRKKPGD
ncbi:hypothetical protein BDW75DRAFT_240396 [Aspergillus navahoensis]